MRTGTRIAGAGAVALLALLTAASASPAQPPTSSLVQTLASQPCPRFQQVLEAPNSLRHRADALRGTFFVLSRPIRLTPPVNWRQDPYRSRNWTQALQQWRWMDPLFRPYLPNGNVAALRRARDLALDWIPDNRPSGWRPKVTADRAGYLGYLVRAAACRRLLSDAQAAALLRSALEHGRYLAGPEHQGGGNQVLFVATGLLALTHYLPFLPQAGEWRALAEGRFLASLRDEVQPQEGVDLEHSPSYHFLVYNLVSRTIGFFRDPSTLAAVRNRMRGVAGWLVMPDGRLPRLGDTAATKVAPAWARSAARRLYGIAPTTASGLGIVKLPGRYLAVSDGLWDQPHSHADQLGFELWDRGRRIVTDTGRFGFARNSSVSSLAGQAYTKSAQAHSVLLVDGADFSRRQPFGSGITATGQGAGWYAIQGRNPLVKTRGVNHSRLFLYRPGQALVVVDRVRSAATHTYTRLFQFDASLSARAGAGAVALRAGSFAAHLYDAPAPGKLPRQVVRGRRRPLLGWMNSTDRFRGFVARPVVALRARASTATYVATLGLGRVARAWALPSAAEDTIRLRVALPGRPGNVVTVVRTDNRLTIS